MWNTRPPFGGGSKREPRRNGKERVVLRRRGKEIAAVVPIADLRLLEGLKDRIDLVDARAALAETKKKRANLKTFSRPVQKRLVKRLMSLRENPHPQGVEKLVGLESSTQSARTSWSCCCQDWRSPGSESIIEPNNAGQQLSSLSRVKESIVQIASNNSSHTIGLGTTISVESRLAYTSAQTDSAS